LDKKDDLALLERNCKDLHSGYDSSDEEKPKTLPTLKNLLLVEKLLSSMKAAAEKRRKEGLKSYFTKTYKKEHFPGELTVGSG
jgi:hypothetical protein